MKQNRFKPKPKSLFIEGALVTLAFIASVVYLKRFCFYCVEQYSLNQLTPTCWLAIATILFIFMVIFAFVRDIFKNKAN